MKIYLAGDLYSKKLMGGFSDPTHKLCILHSFYYIHNWMLPYISAKKWDFLLDSGAFSFFGKDTQVDWYDYVQKYVEFINKFDIEHFFELDIDTIVSTEFAEKLRGIIETETGKKPIPVWRPMRGIDYWYRMIEDYPYVAISASGAFDSAWTREKKSMPAIRKMIKLAHEKNTKVHGLGYTSRELELIPFDSVDSTSWIYGNRTGSFFKFDGKRIAKSRVPKNLKINPEKLARINFEEWVRFQKYAINNL